MSFTGNEDQSITLAAAAELTANYREANPGKVLGGYFSRDAINEILDQINCVGIRYYNAITDTGVHTIVLVGALANENDMESGELAEFATPCPPFSSANNDLNS